MRLKCRTFGSERVRHEADLKMRRDFGDDFFEKPVGVFMSPKRPILMFASR